MKIAQRLDEMTGADQIALAAAVCELAILLDAPERTRLNEIVFRYMAGAFFGELSTGDEDFLVGREAYFDVLLLAWQTIGHEKAWRLRPRTRLRIPRKAILAVN